MKMERRPGEVNEILELHIILFLLEGQNAIRVLGEMNSILPLHHPAATGRMGTVPGQSHTAR